MPAAKTYGAFIKKAAPRHQTAAFRMIKTGLQLEKIRTKYFLDKRIPNAYRYLNHYAIHSVLKALQKPEQSAWVNLFTPVEILQCFDLACLSAEAMSSYLSGFYIEDALIDYAESEGIAGTLCSYHKTFIGAVDSGIIPKAAFATTTSMICDANINTFRHLSRKHQVPCFMLDIPDTYSKEGCRYVTGQLQELISMLEDLFHRPLDEQRLTKTLIRENQSKQYYLDFLKLAARKDDPSTLTLQMFMLFATHLNIGTPQILHFFKLLYEGIKDAPDFHGKKLFWVHLFPYYQETLQAYFNLNDNYQILTTEMNLDYMEPLDTAHPLEALAKKMICNLYNGSYQRKADFCAQTAKKLQVDGVINFCHWGCKQSSGGVMLLRETMRKHDLPLLVLDGDGMDRRNSHDGQIKTRLEAFLELLDQPKGGD